MVAAIDRGGLFLDIGCANGLLMESVVAWARESGHHVEPFGLDISDKLAELARQRLPQWHDRIFVGNALFWDPPVRFDFVRTELVYVPASRRRESETWSDSSLTSAMRGMENEETPSYTVADLKALFR